MLDRKQLGGVMDRAVAVIIITNRAIEHVIGQNPIERIPLGLRRATRFGRDLHIGLDHCGARPNELAVCFNHAGVTGLNRPELGMVTDLRDLSAAPVEQFQQSFAGNGFHDFAVNCNPEFWPLETIWNRVRA